MDSLIFGFTETIIILFSGISFLAYGILLFTSERMKQDFIRFGLSRFTNLIGILEILGGVGLIIGLKVHGIILLASGGLTVLMLLGFGVRLKMRDGFLLSFPSLFFLIINLYIFHEAINIK